MDNNRFERSPFPPGRGRITSRPQRGKSCLWRCPKGATVLEFALVLPLLLMLACGIMDFGYLYFQLHLANQAAREGARIAATGGTLQNVESSVQNYDSQLQVSMSPSSPTSGSNVTVTVTRDVAIFTPIFSAIFPSFTVTGQAVMRVE